MGKYPLTGSKDGLLKGIFNMSKWANDNFFG